MEIGLLIVRLVIGLTMFGHGTQKLLGWFGGYGLGGTGSYMESLGFRPGRRAAVMAGLAETLGGLFLALGLFTPIGAALVIAVMVTATGSVHLDKGYWNTNGGFELPAVISASAAALAFTGAGAISLDAAFGLWMRGWGWGVAALAAGLAGGMVQLATRQREREPRAA